MGGMHGEFRAVPGDDLPDPVRGERAEQVVGGGEQLTRGGSRPRSGEQLIREIGIGFRESACSTWPSTRTAGFKSICNCKVPFAFNCGMASVCTGRVG